MQQSSALEARCMIPYFYVALGSALGGVARYGFGLMAERLWGESFPWGTIIINIVGSFVIGFFDALTVPEGAFPASPNLRILVMVGVCGGFTTFSAFSLQTLDLAREGSWFSASGNVLLSVTFCLLAVTLGHYSGERINIL
jgi:CrcB protein